MVTLYAIATMASGTPRVVKHQVHPNSHFRREHPTAIIWCRSELDPPKPFIGDHLPRENVVEYVPDRMAESHRGKPPVPRRVKLVGLGSSVLAVV